MKELILKLEKQLDKCTKRHDKLKTQGKSSPWYRENLIEVQKQLQMARNLDKVIDRYKAKHH